MRSRVLLLLLVLIMLTPAVYCEEEKPAEKPPASGVKFPDDMPRPSYLDPSAPTTMPQEYIEISANDYPGLELNLPPLKNRLALTQRYVLYPTHDPKYYQYGGMILNYWGFPFVTSQIILVDPTDPLQTHK